MKKFLAIIKSLTVTVGLLLALHLNTTSHAQPLRFTKVRVTDEGAIQLQWQSRTNGVYRLEYTAELSDQTVWDVLVDYFPTQGTNTIFLDTGKYWTEPVLPHPKDCALRFYRVIQVGTNSLVPPIVTISNPAPGSVLSGEVTINVSISTTNWIVAVRFFVDGEEVEFGGADDNGNASYTINTTEWPNGPHVIFVVAETAAGTETTGQQSSAQSGAGASALVPVTFSNYISKWYFSLPGFDPSLGETQRITAKFEAYSSWALSILDEFDTPVRSASGTGFNMQFDWDGRDNHGFETPPGEYQFILSANQTTLPQSLMAAGENLWLSPMMEATLEGKCSYFIEMPPLPPPLDELYGPLPPVEVKIPDSFFEKMLSDRFFQERTGFERPQQGGASQTTQSPRRPPPKPIKGTPGTVGIAWQGHHPDTTNGIPGFNPPANLVGWITLDPNYVRPYGRIKRAGEIANKFEATMKKYKWKTAFNYGDDKLTAAAMRKPSKGGTNLFNYCNIGLLVGHGIRGASQDFLAASTPSLQTYYPVYRTGVNAYDWVRMSEFDFGGGPGGLRWMGIYACNMLYRENALDMWNKGVLPMNLNLHILLAAETSVQMYPEFGRLWASYMNGGEDGIKRTVLESWALASHKVHKEVKPSHDVIMSSAYWPNCVNDKLLSYTPNDSDDPSEIRFRRVKVWPTFQMLE